LLGVGGLFVFLGTISSRLSSIEQHLLGKAKGIHGTIAADATKGVDSETKTEIPVQAIDDVFVRGQSPVVEDLSVQPVVLPQDNKPNVFANIVEWLKEDWLMKLGALLLLLAIGWFVQYAFINDWVSEAWSIGLSILAGVLIMLGGYYWSLSHRAQGGVLLSLGSAVVLVAVFAAREWYGLFTPLFALMIMFASVTFTMLSSLRFNNRALAYTSVAMAALVPLLTNSPEPLFFSLFSYLLVVALGSLWVVYITNWRGLILENFIIVSLFSVPYWLGTQLTVGINEVLFIFVFAALFFITSLVGILRSGGSKIGNIDMVTAFGIGVFIFLWTITAAPSGLQTFILLAWALVFALTSYSTYLGTKSITPFILYGGVALALVAFATVVEFDGAMLMMAYTAEVAIASIAVLIITKRRVVASSVAALFIVPILISFEYLTSPMWSNSVTFDGAMAVYLLVVAMIVTAIGIMFISPLPKDTDLDEVTMPGLLIGVSTLYLFLLIWMIPHALASYTVATAVALVVYTTIGLIAYFLAGGKYYLIMHRLGQLILMGVVLRLLLVDIWHLETAGKIVVFALVGAALISTAFAKRNRKI